MDIKIALATVADSRSDFYERRKLLVEEEISQLDWLKEETHVQVLKSPVIRSHHEVIDFAEKSRSFGAQTLIIHIPIWSDPILSIQLANEIPLPILLLGNSRPETSSIVGLLGAGGALHQIGKEHQRYFDHNKEENRQSIMSIPRAVAIRNKLRGQKIGLFGGPSLGIFTANVDAVQWQKMFGIDVEYIDQLEIIQRAESLSKDEVDKYSSWLHDKLGAIKFSGLFTPEAFDRQVKSYIATKQLVKDHKLDFLGVKCQSELSDGYSSQCVSHMLMNGNLDSEGDKNPVVHACESDADGALSMQILHLLSDGKPTALLDIRWFNHDTGTWILANCGAMAASFFATENDESGLSSIKMGEHVFGKGGGGSLPAVVTKQTVTLARLCRKDGEYWMAIIPGEVKEADQSELSLTTSAFPQAHIRSTAGESFLQEFGSNHIHMVSGEYSQDLITFCNIIGISYKIWN